MSNAYDTYYQTENLFGNPYPELIDFFSEHSEKGRVLDLGCGQGRDAIAIARLGFEVVGIDSSKIGIEQMNQMAQKEGLALKGSVADIFEFDDFDGYDFVLLDSMLHFAQKDRQKETGFVKKIITKIQKGCQLVLCIQDTGNKVRILNEAARTEIPLERSRDKKFEYVFEEGDSGHTSKTKL